MNRPGITRRSPSWVSRSLPSIAKRSPRSSAAIDSSLSMPTSGSLAKERSISMRSCSIVIRAVPLSSPIGSSRFMDTEARGSRDTASPCLDFLRRGRIRPSPSMVEDRFFPFYRYQHDLLTGERQWDALLVYQHHQTETFTKDALLPLYSYEHDSAEKTRRWSLLGVPPLMLFSDQSTPAESSGHLFPIYGYRGRTDEQRLTLLGFPPLGDTALSLYEHRRTEGEVVDRFFPVYRYVRHPKEEETEFNLLLAYHHYSSPQKTEE